MPSQSDITLLRRWRDQRDARAFRTLTQRYGGLVFGICHRMLKNGADAEEVTQDCFLKLARNPEQVERTVGPWLHSVAVRGSLDLLRADKRRRRRESAYGAARPSTVEYATDDLLEYVDEAISKLPEELRRCVVGHFLENQAQSDMAAELGVSTRTVRRRTDEAIKRVRQLLDDRGVTAGIGVVAATLAGLKAEALPASLAVSLGKIAMGGKARTGLVKSWAVAEKTRQLGGIIIMKKGIGAVIALALGLAAWYVLSSNGQHAPEGEVLVSVEDTAQDDTNVDVAADDSPGQGPAETVVANVASTPEEPDGVEETVAPLFDFGFHEPRRIEDPTEYGTVVGTALDSVGRAVPNARVTVLASGYAIPAANPSDELEVLSQRNFLDELYSSEGHNYSAVTDSQGEYAVSGIRYSGSVEVGIQASGFRFSKNACSLEPGEVVTANFRLEEGLAVHGKVLTPAKSPVTDATIHCFAQNTPEGQGRFFTHQPRPFLTRTDSNGDFSLWADESLGTLLSLRVQSDTLGENVFNMIPLGADEPVILTLEPRAGILRGQLLTPKGEGAAGHHIVLRGGVTSYIAEGELRGSGTIAGPILQVATDENGHFLMEDVPTMAAYWANVYTPDGRRVHKEMLEPLNPGETNTWNRTLDPPIQLSGTVRGTASREGLANVPVVYFSDNASDDVPVDFGHVRTDETGAFEINLVAGSATYFVTPGYNESDLVSRKTDQTRELALSPGDEKTLEFWLPEPWSQTLRVLDQFGAPIAGIQPHARYIDENGRASTAPIEDVTDGDGMITVNNVPPDTVLSLTFRKPEYITLEGIEFHGEPGVAYPTESIVLYRVASASAQLVDGGGSPLSNLAVACTAQYHDGRMLTVDGETDGNGWLLLEGNLPASTVILTFSARPSDSDRLEGQIDAVELAAIELNALGTLTLRAGVP